MNGDKFWRRLFFMKNGSDSLLNKLNMVFILVVLVVMLVPYILAHREIGGRASEQENRMLASYPSVVKDNSFNTDYFTEFNDWIQDNIRGRSVVVEAATTAQYKLFGKILKNDTIEGKEGVLFRREDLNQKYYQGLNDMSLYGIEGMAGDLIGIDNYLRDRGIAFCYFVAPDKEMVYPELYVDGVIPSAGPRTTEQMMERLRFTGVNHTYCLDDLLSHKDEGIYYKYFDTVHWNENGAFYGYQSMMNMIKLSHPEIEIKQLEDYNIRMDSLDVNIFGMKYKYKEEAPSYILKEYNAVDVTDTIDNYFYNSGYTKKYVNPSVSNDVKVLVFGDSFVEMFLKDDIAETVGELMCVDWLNLKYLPEILEEFPADVVVFEHVDIVSDVVRVSLSDLAQKVLWNN